MKSKAWTEKFMQGVFFVAACASVLAVALICIFLFANGIPAMSEIGFVEFITGTEWRPNSEMFGILPMIVGSLYVTAGAIIFGVPIGILTSVFMAMYCPKQIYKPLKAATELLAGIPSVIYGLLGIYLLNPLMYKIEMAVFRDSTTHRFTGGANLISAVIVLAIMILPTVINVSVSALHAVPRSQKMASLAMGASPIQTIFKVLIPHAKSGIISAVVLGTGRAIGEAMAITLVSGSSVNFPLPFNAVRFLTTAIVAEMGYASGLHRQVLFTIGLVLFVFIMCINVTLTRILKGVEES